MQSAYSRHIYIDRLRCLSGINPLVYTAEKEYNGYEQERADTVKLGFQEQSGQVIAGFGKINVCQFHFGRYITRQITAEHFTNGRRHCFCGIWGHRPDVDFKKEEQEVIMDAIGLIVFLAICGGPFLILGIICIWRDFQWDKHHKDAEA